MRLTPQQQQAAEAMATGKTAAEAAARVGVHPSTVSRWSKLAEFETSVNRAKAKPSTAPPTAQDDSPKASPTPRQLGKYALHKAISAAQQGGSAADWARVAQLAAKLLDDDEASSPQAMVAALNGDHDLAAKLVAALDPAALSVLAEATFEKQTAALGLSTPDQLEAFQHSGYRLSEPVATEWAASWRVVFAMARLHALKLDAAHRHSRIAEQHGDVPDADSIWRHHPVDPTAVLEAARTELERMENTTNAL